jgi:membrane protease YdiL (CAAX protease family)
MKHLAKQHCHLKDTPWRSIITLTAYIFVVNSYALFSVYPALKQADHRADLVTVSIYLLLILPVVVYTFRHAAARPRLRFIIGGMFFLAVATYIRSRLQPLAADTLLLHAGFYALSGFAEETLWRGILWKLIARRSTSKRLTLLLVTCHFALLHVPFAIARHPAPLLFIAQVFGLGLFLGIIKLISRSITLPALAHATVNMIVYT